MEKIKSNYDHKDYMRMAMLKHEETFKEQVYELHRLYRMQKMLMQNVALNHQKQERYLVDSNKGFTIDYNRQDPGQRSHLTNVVNSHQSNISIMGLHGPENDQVLRPGPMASPYNTQEHIEESNNNVNTVLDETEIELTLSLGPSTHNPRRRKTESGHDSLSSSSTGSSQTGHRIIARGDRRPFTWGSSTDFPQGSDLDPTFSNGPPNNSSPWLFQALSLKSST